jgi:hypothetical protein
MGDERDTHSTATSGWQEFQSRDVRSFDMPAAQQGGSSGGRVANPPRLSDPSLGLSSCSTRADQPSAAAIGDRVEQGEQPTTPRGGNSSGSFFSSGNREAGHDSAATAGASLSSQQQVLPVLPGITVYQASTSAAMAGGSGDAAQRQPVSGGSSTGVLAPALNASTGGRGFSPSDTASVRSGVGSPVSQLAARASAVAAAVAAAAAAGEGGNLGAGTSVLPTSGSSSSFNSGQNDSAAFATSGSNLPSDAALFSRSGWASMHPQQQQQQAAHQSNVGARGGGYDHGPKSLF